MNRVYGVIGCVILLLIGAYLLSMDSVQSAYLGMACFTVVLVYYLYQLIKAD